MSDQIKPPGQESGKDLSMEVRLLIAFGLMAAVLFLSPYFFPSSVPAENGGGTSVTETAPPAGIATGQSPKSPATEADAPPEIAAAAEPGPAAERITAEEQPPIRLQTAVFDVTLSNAGGVVTSWILKDYAHSFQRGTADGGEAGARGQELNLVNQQTAPVVGYPFSIEPVEAGDLPVDPNKALYRAEQTADGLGVTFEFSDGATYIRKEFRFRAEGYMLDFSSEVRSQGRTVPHLLVWRGGFGDATVPAAPTKQHALYFDLAENKLKVLNHDKAGDGPITNQGRYSFAGLDDAYFAAVAVPQDGDSFVVRTYSDLLVFEPEQKKRPHVGAGVGGAGLNSFSLFVGPKDLDLLEKIDPKLQQIVDFGWFAILAKPLFLVLKWVNNEMVHNWGWAIILVTIAINVILLPLKLTSMKSMKKMQALQPQVQSINDKYKGIGMRDPKMQQKNEELMQLYQKHVVNPMGGCMPMVLQIPFFFAFFKVLTVAIELRGAEWLWVKDLSQPEHLAIRVLPLAMIGSQFLMQRMTPTSVGNPSQQRIMMMMPLFMGFMFYGFSSGLVLYWLTSNVVGVAQQALINRLGPSEKIAAPAGAEAGEPKAKKIPTRKKK